MKGTLTLEFRENKDVPLGTEFNIAFDIEEFNPVVFANALALVAEQTSDNPKAIESLLFWAMMMLHKKDADGDADENDGNPAADGTEAAHE